MAKYKVRIKEDKKKGGEEKTTTVDSGFVAGHRDGRLVVEIFGDPTYEDMLSDIGSVLYHAMKYTDEITKRNHKKDMSDEIHKRATQQVSLILDKFKPQKADQKTYGTMGILTDEDILRAEEEKLKRANRKSGKTKVS